MKRVCMLASILVLAVSAPALAQDVPRGDFSVGYQLINLSIDVDPTLGVDASQTLATGWYFDVAGNINPMLGVVFQVGGNYKSIEQTVTVPPITATASVGLSVHQFMGGLRVNARSNPAVTPFGEVLAGAMVGSVDATVTVTGLGTLLDVSDSGTNFALAFGGGADIRVSDRFGIRAKADYIRIFEEGGGANVFRLGVGVVFPF
jgi:opacity protein-like surface antigen